MKNHASMNRIYRLVWNAALGLWVAVAENAKGRGKSGRAAYALLAVLAILSPSAHAANAADASVVSGTGSVATQGLTTTINQTSQRLAIDWTQLSTAANEALKFNQPNAQAIALNRIIGSSPSELLGSLTANGQVFILNPNGVLFGAGSQVNVGGLVASTLSMSNADFMSGNHVFTNSGGTGSVVNQGTMTAAAGGYLALLAPEVRNEGVMTASLGTALLAAGNKVTLNLDNGSLLGYSIDQGAINALAENKQLIQADGGQVLLSARAMDSLTTATVNNTGIIEAKTLQNKAGRIMLMGDMETGTVNVAGMLDASAPNGGDGGFIETSAAHVKVAAGTRVTTQASSGQTGQWLVDPQDYTVAASGGDITGADLSANLGTTNVTLQSSGGGTSGNGDININDAVSWNANTLTLTAARDINVGAVVAATGSAALVMNTSTANGASSAVAGGLVKMALGPGGFTGRVDLATGTSLTINNEAYTIINSLGAQADVAVAGTLQGMRANASGAFALGSDIDASATIGWDSGKGFNPLFGRLGTPFSGRFNGLGHTIGNLVINRTTFGNGNDDGTSLFGTATAGARIGNIGMAGGNIFGGGDVGSLLGTSTGDVIIYRSYSSATVRANLGSAGGLVGVFNGAIRDSYATGTVTGASAGGLAASVGIGSVTNSYATGDVTGGSAGGLVAVTGTTTTISGSYATGAVTSSTVRAYVGGLVGAPNGGSIINSWASGNVMASGTLSAAGGLVGGTNGTATAITGSYATGNVSSGGSYVGGLVGHGDPVIISSSYATGSVTVTGDPVLSHAGGLVGRMQQRGSITSSYATGAVLGTGNSTLNTDNITFGTAGGLVGLLSGGNLFNASVTNSYATGTVGVNASGGNGARYVGGLVGASLAGPISNSYATGAVTGPFAVGGLVGSISGDSVAISGSYASGATSNTGGSGSTGGLVGLASAGAVANSYATGNVNGGSATGGTGGLVGATSGLTVFSSYAANVVSGPADRGGLGGSGNGAFNNSFWNADTSTASFGLGTSASNSGAAPLTAAQFKIGTSFTGAGWNVSSVGGSTAIWRIYEGNTAPLLRNLLTAVTLADAPDSTLTYDASSHIGPTSAATVTGLLGSGGATGRNAGVYSGYYSVQRGGLDITGGNLIITPLALTVTGVTANGKVYDAGLTTTLGGTASVTALAGDTVGITGTGTGTFADKNAGDDKPVTASGFTLTGASAGNYTITPPAGLRASITRADLVVNAVIYDRGYNADTFAYGYAPVTPLGGDDVSAVTGSLSFADKNAGTNKPVNFTPYTLTGADAGNYNAVQPTSLTASITQAPLTLSIPDVVKTYDGTTSASGTTVVTGGGLYSGDSISGGNFAFADKNVGIGNKVVNVSGVRVGDGVNNSNYDVTYVSSSTSTINKADLTVTASGVNKVYDGTTAATVGYGYTRLGTDVLDITGSASFGDKDAGIGKMVNVTGIALAGADAGNYNLVSSTSASTTADITPKALGVTANADTRQAGTPYSGGNGVSYSGFVAGETVAGVLTGSLAYGGSSQGASVAGDYDITPGGLVANSNYSLNFIKGRLKLTGGDAASAALGKPELVSSYTAVLSAVAGVAGGGGGSGGSGSGGGSSGGGGGGVPSNSPNAAGAALNAAASDSGGDGGDNK